jgi:predicted aspartyl protease
MRDRWWGLGVLLSLALTGQSFAMGDQEIGPRPPIEGAVSFDLYRGYLMVARGSAGTLRGLTFLVDTGTSASVLEPRLAAKLHLERRATSSIAFLGSTVKAERAVVPSLDFGPMHAENVPVLIEDLYFLQKTLPIRVHGIIGLDVLGQSAFVIDYPARQIHFGPLPAFPDAIPLHMTGGLPIIDAEVNHLPARLLLDTGALSLFLFARSIQTTAKVNAAWQSSEDIGKFERDPVKLKSLKLGTAEFGREPAFVIPSSGHAFDGLISPAGLGIKKVAIDLGRGEVAFTR